MAGRTKFIYAALNECVRGGSLNMDKANCGRAVANGAISVRRAALSDAPALLDIYNYYITNTAVTFEDDTLDNVGFAERMSSILSFYPYFVAEVGGEVVGYAYAGKFKNRSAYDWAVETTVYVKNGMEQRGIGSALYSALEGALRSQGIKNMYACIACPKREDKYLTFGSVNFHKRLGFRLVGKFKSCGSKFGVWYDMVWMEKFIAKHTANPVRPQKYKNN